ETTRMGAAWSVLRRVADLPRRPRRGHRHDLRGRRERGARREHLAHPRPREAGTQSSDGLEYGDSGLKLSKVSGLTAAHGRLFAGAEMPGVFESRDAGETWKLLSTLENQPGSEGWNDPANQPPGHLGVPAILPHPEDPA